MAPLRPLHVPVRSAVRSLDRVSPRCVPRLFPVPSSHEIEDKQPINSQRRFPACSDAIRDALQSAALYWLLRTYASSKAPPRFSIDATWSSDGGPVPITASLQASKVMSR